MFGLDCWWTLGAGRENLRPTGWLWPATPSLFLCASKRMRDALRSARSASFARRRIDEGPLERGHFLSAFVKRDRLVLHTATAGLRESRIVIGAAALLAAVPRKRMLLIGSPLPVVGSVGCRGVCLCCLLALSVALTLHILAGSCCAVRA